MPSKKEIAGKCWKHGSEALAKQNWDLAIQMFAQAAILVPDNLVYRQTLRGTEKRKYGGSGKGASFSGAKLMGVRSRIKKARSKKEWDALDKEAEEGLKVDPWDTQLNLDVAEACENREFLDVAKFAYSEALSTSENNVDIMKRLANVLEERHEYKEALTVWTRIQKLEPDVNEHGRKITQLHTQQMVHKTEMEDAQTARDLKPQGTAYDEASGLDRSADGPGSSPEFDLQRAIRKDPENVANHVKLADLYAREKKLDEAAETMKKAVELSKNDRTLKERYEDIELARMRKQYDDTARKARETGDESRQKRAVKMKKSLFKTELDVYTRRVEHHPKDLKLKFELGKRYMQLKSWDDAIPLLQQSAADNRIETEARVLLGEAFLGDGKVPLAKRQFTMAAEKIDQHDQTDLFLKTNYALGRIAQDAGDLQSAERHYGDVLSLDYNYRDARERLETMHE